MSSPEELMAESMALVPKMVRILQARGMPESTTKLDFGPVEEALGCPLPEDFKAIAQATTGLGCWQLPVESLYSPDKMVKTREQLIKGYACSPSCVELDWAKDTCFVPIASNDSAFYYGYIKDEKLKKCHKLVALDGEGSLEYNEASATDLPLGILMYRFIVRAVTPELWQVHGRNRTAAAFWTSEGEAEDREEGMSCSAKDGSQDHAASDGVRIVVLGRPVFYMGTPDYDDEEEEDFPTASVFKGASEEDFMGVGVYGLTHPDDQEEEDRQRAEEEAPKVVASVSVEGLDKRKLTDLGFDPDLIQDPELESRVVQATILKQRLSVGEQATALVAGDGHFALLNPLDERLWWSSEAQEKLDEGESFTQVALGGQCGYALTSNNRLLKWGFMDDPIEFQFVTLPEDLGPIRQVVAGGVVALVLKDGRLATVGRTGATVVPGLQNVVRVSSQSDMWILHGDGTVSKSPTPDPHKGDISKVNLPAKIVAIQSCGNHQLFLAADGGVYGMGGPGNGALPLAVTPERIEAYEASQKHFKEQAKALEERLEAFDKEMKEYCQSHPEAANKKPRTDDPYRTFRDRTRTEREKLMCRLQEAEDFYTTDAPEGAPAFPEDLKEAPEEPMPCITTRNPPKYSIELNEPTLLTVGPEHGRLMELSASLTPKDSWNYVKGPYGLPCASTTPVVAVTGTYSASIFLHQDGKLSGCGQSSDLTLGIQPPDEDEEEEEEKEEEDNKDEKEEEKDDENEDEKEGQKEGMAETSNEEEEKKDEEDEDEPEEKIPVSSRHVCSQKAGHCYITVVGDIGMPAAATLPDETRMIAVEAGPDGCLAVDSEGQVWGCGATVGRPEPGCTYELLHILEKQTDSKE